jgi:hypothetical protein
MLHCSNLDLLNMYYFKLSEPDYIQFPMGGKCIRAKSENRKEVNSIVTNYYQFTDIQDWNVEGILNFLLVCT